MASGDEKGDLESWEKAMACCFPWGFVMFKEGCGSSCCVNVVLGAFLGCCCVHVCHACSYVGKPAAPGTACATIAVHGELGPITGQPRSNK